MFLINAYSYVINYFNKKMNEEKILPDYNQIINLEKIANKNGSGINFDQLVNKWKFQYVWKKGSDTIDNISSSLLQVLTATLELTLVESNDDSVIFEIKNSIKCGVLSIAFCGQAFLKGNRPLLYFYFRDLSLKVGKLNIFNKKFEEMDIKKMPFFSLIAIDKNKEWLCARGKGGGLAIWTNS
tara:strand:+ start:30 stop:578 length:549 start_codon:yes stop_codon:yes gene_type:complete